MKRPASHPDDTELASGFTVATYRAAVKNRDRHGIAEAIRRRFDERYIAPVDQSKAKHGFAMMAICCLMIESLESFRQGWKSSDGHEEEAFIKFFQRERAFSDFVGFETFFYRNVRCGILHQGETYHGWKIIRTGVLFEPSTRTINATQFLRKLGHSLNAFCDHLTVADWSSDDWARVNRRMRALCAHCTP